MSNPRNTLCFEFQRKLRSPLPSFGLAGSILGALVSVAGAQEVQNRVSVLVGSSSSMLLTPEIVVFPESCVALNWNGCVSSGNPSAAQEQCNACMAWTIRANPTCATSFTSACRSLYTDCWRSMTGATGCGQTLALTGGVSTRGDGAALTPGCDVDGDGQANDSRIYQVKDALRAVIGSADGVEFSLWRYAQVEGGQACNVDSDCPETPAGLSYLRCASMGGTNRCVLDASILGSASGQCSRFSWNGADASFSCAQCSDSFSDRLECEAYSLGRIRTGGVSPLVGTVDCALPSTVHPYMTSHGALFSGGGCDPSGGDRLVDFPAAGAGSNLAAILSWIDHQRTNLASDVELEAHGGSPIAASLRDMREAVLASVQLDPFTPCRKHSVIALLGAAENCEAATAAAAAAGALQDLQFTNASGTVVADYDIPVFVIGFGICPAGQSNCIARQDLDAIAAAGGTGSAILVDDQLALEQAISQIVVASSGGETCNVPAVPILSPANRVALLLILIMGFLTLAGASLRLPVPRR